MTPLNIYLWQTADSFDTSLSMLSFVCAVPGTFLLLFSILAEGDFEKTMLDACRKIGIRALVTCAIAATLATLLPSSKTIALMYVLPEIANSKVMQQDVPELYDMAVKALKDQLSSKE